MCPQRRWGSDAWHLGVVAGALLALLVCLRLPGLEGYLGGLHNDHFPVMVRASEMLQGRLPLRDYGDYELRSVWPPLSYLAPAVSAMLLGDNLLAEVTLSLAVFWIAAVLTYLAARQLGVSMPVALSVAVLQIVLSPRLYAYPKLLIPAGVAVSLLWLARSSRPLLPPMVVGVVGAVAFLVRHDLGVYAAIGAGVFVLARLPALGPRASTRLATRIGATALMMVLPGLIIAQQQVGLVDYVRRCLALTTQEVDATRPRLARFALDWSPLVVWPSFEVPISVRWVAALDPEVRGRKERELGLRHGQTHRPQLLGLRCRRPPGHAASRRRRPARGGHEWIRSWDRQGTDR